MDPAALLDLVLDLLPSDGRFGVDDPAVAAALRQAAPAVLAGPPGELGDRPLDAVLLLAGEVAAAGRRGPAVVDAAVRRCRPGGWVVVAVPSAVHAALVGGDAAPGGAGDVAAGMSAADLRHALAERGLDVRRLASPGAAARVAGRGWRGRADLTLDATPGLVDAGPVVLAVARTPKSAGERSVNFFASIARKIVSASTVCMTPDGRLLVVFDSFKGAWTLPGGLVDEHEDPAVAAAREVLEEGGVVVEPTRLLGVFAHPSPDRINLVYGADVSDPVEDPTPLHDHEIAEVRWVDLDRADALLDPSWRRKVRLCLDRPGGTWTW
ncbi:NUDIX hydrolase [Euzebya sp.]|uniref:NUDIX hydrolase n=1 Tax=Euzebya sp. TaxID=1971409 RepID=UPI003515AFCA